MTSAGPTPNCVRSSRGRPVLVPSQAGRDGAREPFAGNGAAVRLLVFLGVLAICGFGAASAQAQTFGCSPAKANDIVCENSKTGNPPSQWDISTKDAGDPSIQGFATDISVAQGGTIYFKVKTTAKAYRLDIYRMGYYAGNGARLIATVTPSVSLPQTQPSCITQSSTDLYDCGNWAVSASWAVPSNATSGIYFAHLVRTDTGGNSHIVFVVRNDSSHSPILFQTSDEAWQAYNDWGGSSGVLGGHTLYGGPGAGNWTYTDRAYKVSYNRPFDTRSFEAASWVFNGEYPMVRFLEANGYDVTYFTHVDGIRNANLILNHSLYMSNGHDEYWTGTLRANIEAARNAGMNLAFFSGNEVFWKTRWENSVDGSNTPYRTLVCYKETFTETQTDPLDPSTWTGTWRDPSFSPPDDGGRPENNLTGTLFMINGPASDNNGLAIKVPAADGKMRFWRNTSEASLGANATATLPAGTLGYEWDVDPDNPARPTGLFDLSTATYTMTTDLLLDNGVTYGAGPATHHMTMYRAPSGALVFGAGTVQWAWGLDSNHDNDFGFNTPAASKDMQQATINLLADMGVQPATILSTLKVATKSTDTIPPVSTITSPAAGATLQYGSSVTVSGTASDSGGGVVGGVAVSVDGGQTWHPASGRGTWTYSFSPSAYGHVSLLSRAVDDSGNIETPGPGVSVTVPGPYSISGTISPSSAGSGATVALSGTSSATVQANSSGAYTFSGLIAGDYSVVPSQTGYTFGPTSTSVVVNGATVSGINFAATQATGGTYSISGAVTPSTNGSGVTVTLNGTAIGSAFTDASGNFTFFGLPSGAYTVTPSNTGFSFTPNQTAVTVNGASVTGVTFSAAGNAQTLLTTQTPNQLGDSDGLGVNYELGMLFQSNAAGQITAIRFWKSVNETGMHIGNVWSASGQLLVSAAFTHETASGWQRQQLPAPLTIAANTTYVVSVNTGNTFYVEDTGGLASKITNLHLSSVVGTNGVFGTPGKFPTSAYDSTNYFRDVEFVASGSTPSYSISGTLTPVSAGAGATVTLSGGANTVTTADSSGNYSFGGLIAGAYTVTPNLSGFAYTPLSQPVTINTTSVTGVNFTGAVSLVENIFTTQAPAQQNLSDGSSVNYELGTVFTSGIAGQVTGIRFWKASSETGTHTGHIWSSSGQSLASVTFSNETASGWQQQSLLTPLTIAANTQYVVSVNTGSTYYVETDSGLATQIVNKDLSTVVGSNGLYGTSGKFPTSSVDQTNYFRDIVFLPTVGPTYTASGAITPTAGGAGATLALSGPVAGTTVADASGNFTFTGLSNGNYTAAPSNSGYTFAPPTQSFTVSGANVTGLAFTANVVPTYSISGTISPTAGGSGATVKLSGTASATVSADSSGAFTFTGIPSGSYTVTPSNSGYTFSPPSTAVIVSNASVANVTFTAAVSVIQTIAVDATASADGTATSKTIKTPAFSTTAANELLLAFVSADGPSSGTNVSVSSVAGGSLTWALVVRTNTQLGTAEIWRAFATTNLSNATVTATLSKSEVSSITVMSFTGVKTSGTNGSGAIGATGTANASSGAPSATLTTTQNASLVVGVGNDWDNAIARTVGTGQALIQQYLPSVGDTYWVQMQTALTPLSGTSVTINDTAPTSDSYNLSICEILAGP